MFTLSRLPFLYSISSYGGLAFLVDYHMNGNHVSLFFLYCGHSFRCTLHFTSLHLTSLHLNVTAVCHLFELDCVVLCRVLFAWQEGWDPIEVGRLRIRFPWHPALPPSELEPGQVGRWQVNDSVVTCWLPPTAHYRASHGMQQRYQVHGRGARPCFVAEWV